MSEIKTGYKIVQINSDGSYGSCSLFSHVKGFTKYKLNKWVNHKKNCGPLAVFDFLNNVKFFIEENLIIGNIKTFECEYIESKLNSLFVYKSGENLECFATPHGTCYADRVKLIKEI